MNTLREIIAEKLDVDTQDIPAEVGIGQTQEFTISGSRYQINDEESCLDSWDTETATVTPSGSHIHKIYTNDETVYLYLLD